MTQQMHHTKVLTHEKQYASARYSLLLLVIFSAINIFSITFGNTYFLFSSYFSTLFTALGAEFYVATGAAIWLVIGIALSLLVLLPYFLLWLFSKDHPGCMVAALVLFAIDTLLVLIDFISLAITGDFSYLMDLLIHAVVLFALILGPKHGYALRRAKAELQSASVEAPTDPADAGTGLTRTITITREAAFAGSAARVTCCLDGAPVAELKNKETVTLTVSDAAHEITALLPAAAGGISVPAGSENRSYTFKVKMGFAAGQILFTEV